jgi:hypothetical protein
MKDSIEPGPASLSGLWEWLKKVGLNYYYLLNNRTRPREKRYIKK